MHQFNLKQLMLVVTCLCVMIAMLSAQLPSVPEPKTFEAVYTWAGLLCGVGAITGILSGRWGLAQWGPSSRAACSSPGW